MNKKDVASAVDKLINQGDLLADPRFFTPKMEVVDIWGTYQHLFTNEAKEAIFSRQVKNLAVQYNEPIPNVYIPYQPRTETMRMIAEDNDTPSTYTIFDFIAKLGAKFDVPQYTRKLGQVRYFGARIKSSGDLDKAAAKVAKRVNECAANNYIIGHLSKLIMLTLASGDVAVMSYLAFNEQGVKYLDSNNIDVEIKEGECPALED